MLPSTLDSPACITDDEVLLWASGALPRQRTGELDAHLDGCEVCQILMAEALRDSRSDVRPGRRDTTFSDGDLISERYRVVRFIARGGMGEVYEVQDLWLRHRVALKTLIPSISDNPAALARLKTEVLTARQVSHPNVCRIFDLGFHVFQRSRPTSPTERIAYLTMELLVGETLSARLKREGPLEENLTRQIALQLIRGLAHAHRSGVIHRDFKCDNVMLVDDEEGPRATITDFGLARSLLWEASEPLTSRQGPLGTLDYMAPEQVTGQPVTRQADLFALGVVLFQMTTGRLPFDGDTPVARALKRTHERPPRPSAYAPRLSRESERAILWCLALEPANRPQGADDLERHFSGVPAPRPRSTALWVFAASVLLLGGAAGAMAWKRQGDAARDKPSPSDPAASSSLVSAPPGASPSGSSSSPLPVVANAEPQRTEKPPAAAVPASTKPPAVATSSRAKSAPDARRSEPPGVQRAPASRDRLLDPFESP